MPTKNPPLARCGAEDAGTALRSVRPTTEPADESPEQAIARIREVRNRAEKMFEWRIEGDPLLDIALDHLTLGRTYLAEAELQTEPPALAAGVAGESDETAKPEASACGSLQQAEQHLNQSVSLLRQSGRSDWLPRGLLHRAALWRVLLALGERPGAGRRLDGKTEREEPAASAWPLSSDELLSRANRDLSEAESIAERGSMLIWQIEAALERTRLAQELQDFQAAKEHLDRARGLVHQTDKPYEPYQSTWEDWDPPESANVFQPGEIVGYHRRDAEIERLQLQVDSSANRR